MLILVTFLGFWAKKQRGGGGGGGMGGLTPEGEIKKPAHFVFSNCWVVTLIWQSFIQKGEMACITPA